MMIYIILIGTMKLKINYVGVSFVNTPTFYKLAKLIALYTKQLSTNHKKRKCLISYFVAFNKF